MWFVVYIHEILLSQQTIIAAEEICHACSAQISTDELTQWAIMIGYINDPWLEFLNGAS